MTTATNDRPFWAFNAVLSAAALSFLAYILMVRTAHSTLDLRFMPAVNASFNAISATLLTVGWIARQGVAGHDRRAVAR